MADDIKKITLELDRVREENVQLRQRLEALSVSGGMGVDHKAMAMANVEAAELVANAEEANVELARANANAAELMAELEITGEQLKRANEEKNGLLGMISHDIGNGIAMIGMSAEVLAKQAGVLGEKPQRALDMMRNHCKSLGELLSKVLDISRIYDGKMDPKYREASIGELVNEITSLFTLAAEGKGQALNVYVAEGLSGVPMDRAMIHQVITNLLSNAIKFTPEGGKIVLSVGEEGECCQVSICDSGPGLTEADREKLFGAFCKLSAKPTGGEKSHGLGLAICKRLVEIHRGEIGAKDNPSGGTCFYFTLPMK